MISDKDAAIIKAAWAQLNKLSPTRQFATAIAIIIAMARAFNVAREDMHDWIDKAWDGHELDVRLDQRAR